MFDSIITATALESFLEPQLALVEEARWHLDEDGVHVTAVDPANVGMVKVDLEPRAFESYSADGGLIGINLGQLDDVLGVIGSDQIVHMSLNEDTRKLELSADTFEYTLALIDPDTIRGEPEIPDIELPATITVEGRYLDRGATAADLVSDRIAFAADPDDRAFVMKADGDTDDTRLSLSDEELTDAQVPESVRSLFSLDYINDLVGPIDAGTEVTVRLGDEFPFRWEYSMNDGAQSVVNNLAPRIATDGGDRNVGNTHQVRH